MMSNDELVLLNTDELMQKLREGIEALDEADKSTAKEAINESLKQLSEMNRRIENHPQNTDKNKLKLDVTHAVVMAEGKYRNGADKLKYAVSMLRDMGYNTEKSLSEDGTQFDDLIRASVESRVFSLNLGRMAVMLGIRPKAESSSEFKDKYSRKRFTPATIGKAHIFTYVYWTFLRNEGFTDEEIVSRPLYDIDALREKIDSDENAYRYNQLYTLENWVASAFEKSLFMRNNASASISYLGKIASGAVDGENLKIALGDRANDEDMASLLALLSIDSITPASKSYWDVLQLRIVIENCLRFIIVYSTMIHIISTLIDLPELDIYQTRMDFVETKIETINKTLQRLRELVEKRETVLRDDADETSEPFTESFKAEVLRAFRDMPTTVPPIPKENITAATAHIKNNIINGNMQWQSAFDILSRNYWRR